MMKRLLPILGLLCGSLLAATPPITNGGTCENSSNWSMDAILPVYNDTTISYIRIGAGSFETLDKNRVLLQSWADLKIIHSPSAAEPWLDATFGSGDTTHQEFSKARGHYCLIRGLDFIADRTQ